MKLPATTKLSIGIIGTFQVGKSTLLNCLLADTVAEMGVGVSTTHAACTYAFGEAEGVKLFHDGAFFKALSLDEFRQADHVADLEAGKYSLAQFTLRREILLDIEIVDTPGLNAGDKLAAQDSEITMEWMAKCDALIVVMDNKEAGSVLKERVIRPICATGKPFIVLMNCSSQQSPDPSHSKNCDVAKTVAKEFEALGCRPHSVDGHTPVWLCNLAWYWVSALSKNGNDTFIQSEKMRSIFSDREKDIQAFFQFRKFEVPTPIALEDRSRFLPVCRFLSEQNIAFQSIQRLIGLNQAFREWQYDLVSIAKS